ncbi:hypothetical protein C6569_03805 [Phreatobacter cathodiphilus]|uniref:Uncharacterized protein n=2 Tax=Phreatobacter cathodiphilus TaxID=1868589 RepID=A0A2S0N7W2_9HYPH|nr:hypothetical protein C6569_03805 [Phreatobacter cathodiphilus]
MVIVGFSNGTRVGEYRPNVDGQRRLVGTTPACLANPSYARELGRLIDSNRVAFRGRTISLDETCRRER